MISMRNSRVNKGEWYAVTLSFIYFFCILAAYYVLRPIREQLSAQVGSAQLPWFFSATFTVTLLLTPLFSWMVSRWPRQIVIPIVYLFFIFSLIAFVPLFIYEGLIPLKMLGISFFVWVSVFNLFVVSVFWSFMADIWSDMQARRLFPIIALGGTFGAIMGPLITRNLVEEIGLASLLSLSAGLLFIAVICIVLLGNWAKLFSVHGNEAGKEVSMGGGMLDGLKQIFTNKFIGSMAVLVLLSDAIGTIGYVLITDYSSATYADSAIARTRFAANIDLSANVIEIIVQLTLTRWLLVRYGAGIVFVVWSVILGSVCVAISLTSDPYHIAIGTMPWVALIVIIARSLSFGLLQPAKESLFTLVPRDQRFKGKNAVDTVVWRSGDIMSLLLINRLQALGIGIAGFGMVGTILIAISGMVGWRISKRVEGNVEK